MKKPGCFTFFLIFTNSKKWLSLFTRPGPGQKPQKKQSPDIGSLEKPDLHYSTMYVKDNLMRTIFNKEYSFENASLPC